VLSLRHIEVFREVYLTGSVTGAARELNVSQPSISKVLRHAESRLKFALFRRLKGRLVPTDEAHSLFREVDELYGRLESLKQTARNLQRMSDGNIRLAVLPSLGLGVAPQAVAAFRASNPRVGFDIRTLHHNEILRALYERECDLAVGYDVQSHPRLTAIDICLGEVGLLFRKTDIPNPPDRIGLDVLKAHDFIGVVGSGPVGNLFSSQIEVHGLDLPEVISVHTYFVAAALVRYGAGVAVVDEFTARAALTPDLVFRPLEPRMSFKVQYVFLNDRPPSNLLKGFITTLSDTIRQATHSLGA
jgi:DNA-binding transcriptional LysR family regulator